MLTKVINAILAISVMGFAAHAEDKDDPYLWLEEVESEKALDWARAQNERSQKALEDVADFKALYADALSILTSDVSIISGRMKPMCAVFGGAPA